MRSTLRPAIAIGSILVATAGLAHQGTGPVAAPTDAVPDMDVGAIRQDYAWDESRLVAESFWLSPEATAQLAAVPFGDHIVVAGFPVGPGERATVYFERFDVYAPGARITVVDEAGEREIPYSDRVHLLGTAIGDPHVRVGLSLDPDGTHLSGLVSHAKGTHDFYELEASSDSQGPVYEIGRGLASRLEVPIQTRCDTGDQPQFFDAALAAALAGEPQPHSPGDLHLAVLAFDTDGELIQNMFAGSTANTNTAIGDFVTASNVIYERDMMLRLQQGDTVLRADPNTDPYVSTSTGTQLTEVEEWWAANKGGTFRTFVALLSGKSPSDFSGAGIAWVGAYCNNGSVPAGFDGGSFSATQVLKGLALNSAANVGLLDHEIGHNAGSGHTHCYMPEIDQCYNAQMGCYAGPESCPDHTAVITGISAGAGTIMSYCGLGGVFCPTENFFHPTVIANVKGQINTAHAGSCVTHVATTCTVGTVDLPVSGMANGMVTHEACNSITYTNWTSTAAANVTARAPKIILGDNVEIGGQFTAQNVVP